MEGDEEYVMDFKSFLGKKVREVVSKTVEWWNSKKTKNMLVTQLIILAAVGMAFIVAKGDPEQAKALLKVSMPYILAVAGVGTSTILGQAHVDAKKK